MTVLNDTAILARFNSLLIGGDQSRIGAFMYYFVPGKIFPSGLDDTGSAKSPIDWTKKVVHAWPGETAYVVNPGSLVSLRTRELVMMPNDLCGLWYQTDSLARHGLLLVNMSTVPPGYEGPLTCTFVNFGKKSVPITPSTNVAKLLFLPLDAATSRSARRREERDYDSSLADMAREFPVSFLQISDRTKELVARIDAENARLTALVDAAADEARETLDDVLKNASDAFAKQAKDAEDHFRQASSDGAQSAVIKAVPWAAVAILLLGAAQWFATKILTTNIDDTANRRADVMETRINKELDALGRKPVFVYTTGSVESKELLGRMEALENEMKKLQSQAKK